MHFSRRQECHLFSVSFYAYTYIYFPPPPLFTFFFSTKERIKKGRCPILIYNIHIRICFQEESSASWMFVVRLCIKLGLEYSTPLSEGEILDDTDDSGIWLDMGFGWGVWFLKFWKYDGLGASGVGFPWASSASRLRRFMTVGRNLDEMERRPPSC